MERLCSAPRQMPAVDFRQCVIAEVGDGVLPSRTSYSACVVKGVQSTEICMPEPALFYEPAPRAVPGQHPL